ncbi:hypothetical protein [Streptomyces sp. NPDC057694]|uniref:hypothetical protein n=1 Tax=Streptomyces sp. NPDC057694 TaxID=3346216 RepID=UPI0036A04E03
MTRTRIAAALAGALALAAALTGASSLVHQQWATPPSRTEALTTYNPDDPAEVSQTADDVFTATVLDAEDHRRINGLDWNIHRVRVAATYKGTVHGTLDIAVEIGRTDLVSGHAYVFATIPFTDSPNVHGQIAETTPQPATKQAVQTWHRAASHRPESSAPPAVRRVQDPQVTHPRP